MPDEGVPQADDPLPAAVVDIQPDDAYPLCRLHEALHHIGVGAPECIDRLVVIPDAEQVAASARNQLQKLCLHRRNILKLIRIDYVRRLTYLDEGVSPHAIKVCLQFTM